MLCALCTLIAPCSSLYLSFRRFLCCTLCCPPIDSVGMSVNPSLVHHVCTAGSQFRSPTPCLPTDNETLPTNSALPEDIEPWGTARTGRASPATTPQRRRRPMTTLRAAKQSPETGDAFPSEGDKPVSPTAIMHDATCASTEKHGGQSQRAAAAADEDQAVDGSCLDGGSARQQQQQQQQHEWTIDKHLANDPRNYKFLPRWARSGEGVKALSMWWRLFQ